MFTSIFFDIDDTIYDQMVPFDAACRQFSHLKELSTEELYAARSVRGMEALRRMDAGLFSLEENHIYRMQMACRDLGVELSSADALHFQDVYAMEQQRLAPTPGMIRILDLCKASGCFLGVLTNGPGDHQRKKCATLGLDRWIDPAHILASGDCGWLKPDVRIFRLAEQTWGLDPASTFYIGDSFAHDMVGAHNAGWQSFWLLRRGADPQPLPFCPTAVGSEQDLLDFLMKQQKPTA